MLPIPCFFGLVQPCGNVSVPEAGLDVTTPLGVYHVPGREVMKPEVQYLENALSRFTMSFCVLVLVIWVLVTLLQTGSRRRLLRGLEDILAGRLAEEDEELDSGLLPGEHEEEAAAKLDPKSATFVAPGNIYRLLALLSLSGVDFAMWVEYAGKALLCAYMQLYLPFMLTRNVLQAWDFSGVKSPIWIMLNFWNFFAAFIALGALCQLFASKCSQTIRICAEANLFILSRREPEGAARTVRAGGYISAAPMAEKGPSLTSNVAAHFWCWLSLCMNIATALLLQFTMFLTVATFTDQVDHVVVVAVSLYFVFDLDARIMESDPRLQFQYRRTISRFTEEGSSRPACMMQVAALAIALVRTAVPIGLLAIVLTAWRNRSTGEVIGGTAFAGATPL